MPTLDDNAKVSDTSRQLTGEEAALYDRQIRLWGLEAQRKLSSSHVLILGDVTSLLAQELSKNIVLAGVARLCITVTEKDSTATKDDQTQQTTGFLGNDLQSIITSLRDMNPHVEVTTSDEEALDFSTYSVVCVLGLDKIKNITINKKCRLANVPVLTGQAFGFVGWFFLDLGDKYEYQTKLTSAGSGQNGITEGQLQVRSLSFCSYEDALEGQWGGETARSEFGWHIASTLQSFQAEYGEIPLGESDSSKLREYYRKVCEEKQAKKTKEDLLVRVSEGVNVSFPPVNAIVSGTWGREVIKIVSGKEEPLNNFFFFNAITSTGSVEKVEHVVQ